MDPLTAIEPVTDNWKGNMEKKPMGLAGPTERGFRVRKKGFTRREFLELQLYGSAWVAVSGMAGLACNRRQGRETATKVIVLGLDGMDPEIVSRMMREGKMPTFSRVAREGYFGPLGTSTPPQSPVAWANFIAGGNPGRHGIFDFIHRDPATYLPYLSTSKSEPGGKSIRVGDYVIPLSSGKIHNLRRGRAFWEILEDYDIPATVFKMPSNFPPTPTGQRTFSGMGTPDILGTYGMFSYYTDLPLEIDADLGGGKVHTVSVDRHTVKAALAGPENTYRKGSHDSTVDFTVVRDPERPVAKIVIGDREWLLNQGEWSPWIELSFSMMPTVRVKGICRFYLKEVHPHFKLYVTPINIDPSDPALPISTPEDYAKELYERFGPFHTKGLPADTKALDHGVLDEEEFLAFDDMILRERLAISEFELDRFESGLLYLYISSTDQRSHMFWRLADPKHPAYDPWLAARFGDAVQHIYQEMDRFLARILTRVDRNTRLLVLSDHGFTPYYRSFHLNSWLKDQGYLCLKEDAKESDQEFFQNVDWTRTRAYALGFNGLYLNRRGREGMGTVSSAEVPALQEELASRLEALRDPETGRRTVLKAAKADEAYRGPYARMGPDIVVGYNRGTRASWQTALGNVTNHWYETNGKKWSGDHCMAADILPGILLTNQEVRRPAEASLCDVTATILACFGIPVPEDMDGKSIL
jgi:predicted AlkP superfamily phosphohydrolase/phosphomutase